MTLKLVIGNKNYSSWSMRPWLAMRTARIPFAEELIFFDDPNFKLRVGALGSGKVPVLLDGDFWIWESLAILEYLAEKFPEAALWPAESAARARYPNSHLSSGLDRASCRARLRSSAKCRIA